MARLAGLEISRVLRHRLDVARRFSEELDVYVVLKGYRTVVACPDGTAFVNPTGNAAMATAGSGDVLTGILAGVVGQPHLGSFAERLCLAVYLHGLAGDLGTLDAGEETLVASDILRFLPEAWKSLRGA
jgi:NAD(P)H-hydrate epimerase